MRFAPALALAFVAFTVARSGSAAWPPARGADLTLSSSWPNDPGYPQLWSYFSYLPAQAPGAPAYLGADQKLGASGMSVDAAWEYGIGSSSVVIAVLDSGILWEEPDLLEQAWLNPGELTGVAMPRTKSGEACGGAGALSGYDCNGDGVFSVADYAADPRLTPTVRGDECRDPVTGVAKGDRIAGDLNHNCTLDAGDLIELWSDGVDGDANGYTDDISGWDFFKNDNNPYDDTRGGHGTASALASNAQANNGRESVGVCPACRFVMLRVADGPVADSNDVAKALVYAADGAATTGLPPRPTVASVAVTAVNLTTFARAAIDYAYAHDVVVVATMGDDNSRHHASPATYGHVLTVHGVDFSGATPTTSASFVDDVNCTNFGGQLMLSASATGCSDEGAARTAGVVGLVESYALGMTPPITAEEVMQIAKGTADVIDVPESRTPSGAAAPGYYESLPGFSQRFGYGRLNAVAAMRAIDTQAIPPEVEITSPGWFAPLYADRTASPIPILGRVVAARAASYDFSVEWAAGVEPLDADFSPLADTVTDIPGQSVTGGPTVPLGLLDPAGLDTSHKPDPDSPRHENDRTLTIRVRAVAHYASGDVKGEARRTTAVVNEANGLDHDLLPGFPLQVQGSVEGGPKLADINGDGVRDIVLATNDGMLHVFSLAGGKPVEPTHFPYALLPVDGLVATAADPSLPSYLTAPAYSRGPVSAAVRLEAVDGTPAVGDLLGDGTTDIVFASWEGTVYAIDSNGADLPGWPLRLPLVPSCPDDPNVPAPAGDCMDPSHAETRGVYASPVLADLNSDGKLEIVIAAFDGNVYVFEADGSPLPGFPVRVHAPAAARYDRIMSTPAVADYNGDGIPDILVGTDETVAADPGTGFYFAIDGRGGAAPGGPFLPNWPVRIPSRYVAPVVGAGTTASPVAVRASGSHVANALLQGNGSGPLLLPGDPGSQQGSAPPATRMPAPHGFAALDAFGPFSTARRDEMLPLLSSPSVGDLDQDGIPDVVMSGGSLRLEENLAAKMAIPFQHLLAAWSGKTGDMLPGSPMVLEDYTQMGSQAIADLTGDGYPEIIVGTGGYFVHAIDACSREAAGWPKFTDGWVMGTPAVGDINGDHTLEVVAATRDGYLFAWSTAGTDTGVVEWESFHHDNANTGSYDTPLDQGPSAPAAPRPIDCSAVPGDAGGASASSMTPRASSGGCACTIGRAGQRDPPLVAAALAVIALTVRRRRGRR